MTPGPAWPLPEPFPGLGWVILIARAGREPVGWLHCSAGSEPQAGLPNPSWLETDKLLDHQDHQLPGPGAPKCQGLWVPSTLGLAVPKFHKIRVSTLSNGSEILHPVLPKSLGQMAPDSFSH